jgi:hypothetical protein
VQEADLLPGAFETSLAGWLLLGWCVREQRTAQLVCAQRTAQFLAWRTGGAGAGHPTGFSWWWCASLGGVSMFWLCCTQASLRGLVGWRSSLVLWGCCLLLAPLWWVCRHSCYVA